MTEQEELKILRDLVEDHCTACCAGCVHTEIPKTGLLAVSEWRVDVDDPTRDVFYPENASCRYAQYWWRKAVDEMWKSAPCHACGKECILGPSLCVTYQKWVEGLTDVQRNMCAQHWMENE